MNAIDEILQSIQLFFENYGWYIVLGLVSLRALRSSTRLRQLTNDLSLRVANDPGRRRVLDEDRKRIRDAQQATLRDTIMRQREESAARAASSPVSSSDCEGGRSAEEAKQLPQKKALTGFSKTPTSGSSSAIGGAGGSGYNPLMGGGGVGGFRPSGEMRGRGSRGG